MSNSSNLKLIVLDNCKELGTQIDNRLKQNRQTDQSFIIKSNQIRFNNGEGKIIINESIRQKDVYILSDIGNHNCSYQMFGKTTYMGPDEHFQDIKRTISAIKGHASSINIIMPLLYASRQHKRKGRESLDCSIALQELNNLGVNSILTFDAHDPSIQNAIPCMPFENFYPTSSILEELIINERINYKDPSNLLVVSPDTGAMDRARFYADVLKTDVGMCYKRRDLSKIVNGKNPIVAHEYMGKEVFNKDILVVDDMIASGDSILEVAENLKKRGANKIYLISTFALFTNGTKNFNEAYENGLFTKIYSTNLSYVSDEIKNKEWFHSVDCSSYLGDIIDTLNNQQSITPLLNDKEALYQRIKKI